MGRKNRSVELTLKHDDTIISWQNAEGVPLFAEIVIGENLYIYLTEKEYKSLYSQLIDLGTDG